MSDAAPPDARCYWRQAWFAVWSPPAAWLGTFVLLWASNVFPWWVSGAVGVVAGHVGLYGVFWAPALALESLHATHGPSTMSGGEKARLACLSLVGLLVSVVGYWCLLLFGGFVALLSPLRDLQLG